jgi:hypothetical protein
MSVYCANFEKRKNSPYSQSTKFSALNLKVRILATFCWPNSPTRARAVSYSRFLYHTHWQTTVGRISLDEGYGPSQRPLPDSTHHSQETVIHAPDWIRSRNPSKRTAVDSRLRSLGHWDRLYWPLGFKLLINRRNRGFGSHRYLSWLRTEQHPKKALQSQDSSTSHTHTVTQS